MSKDPKADVRLMINRLLILGEILGKAEHEVDQHPTPQKLESNVKNYSNQPSKLTIPISNNE